MSRRRRPAFAAALGGVATLGAGGLFAAPIETPAWELVEATDDWEIREYAPRLEARVTVSGTSFRDAVDQGFRVLASFIFGANVRPESVEMTAPVSAARSTRIDMTAPVAAARAGEGTWVVSFVMPSEYTPQSLPRPTDPRISIVEVPRGRWAASRFRGRAARRHVERTEALMASLLDAGLQPAGDPEVSQYDPPWIPGPLRRNEILVPLAPSSN